MRTAFLVNCMGTQLIVLVKKSGKIYELIS